MSPIRSASHVTSQCASDPADVSASAFAPSLRCCLRIGRGEPPAEPPVLIPAIRHLSRDFVSRCSPFHCDRYPLSPRIQALRGVLAKIRPEPTREPLPA